MSKRSGEIRLFDPRGIGGKKEWVLTIVVCLLVVEFHFILMSGASGESRMEDGRKIRGRAKMRRKRESLGGIWCAGGKCEGDKSCQLSQRL